MPFRYASSILIRYIISTDFFEAQRVFYAGRYAGLEKNTKIQYAKVKSMVSSHQWVEPAPDGNLEDSYGCFPEAIVALIRYENMKCYYYYHIICPTKLFPSDPHPTYIYKWYSIYRVPFGEYMIRRVHPKDQMFLYQDNQYGCKNGVILCNMIVLNNDIFKIEFEKIIYANRLNIKPLEHVNKNS